MAVLAQYTKVDANGHRMFTMCQTTKVKNIQNSTENSDTFREIGTWLYAYVF